MTVEETGVDLTENVTEALRGLIALRGRHPEGTDLFTCCADVLDELARAASLLGEAVEACSGEDDSRMRRHADALATNIVAHRNALVRSPGPVERPRPSGDRTNSTGP